MVLSTVSFGGQKSGDGAWNSTWADQNSMFLRVFGGEVYSSYEKYSVTNGKHRMRSISSGKSAQFPFTGRTTARRFKPGSDILADNAQTVGGGAGVALTTNKLLGHIKTNEKIVKIDDLLISTCFIDDLDLAKSHYDYRGPFSRELGRALAHEFDSNVLKAAALHCINNTGDADPFIGGTIVTHAGAQDAATTKQLIDSIFDASQAMDEKYIPEDERYCFLTPRDFYKLIMDTAGTNGNDSGTAILHRDYGNEGNGNLRDGFVLKCAGMTIVKTPHLPAGDTRSDADGTGSGTVYNAQNPGENNDYQGDFSKVQAICWHPEAVGTVKLKELTMESDYQIRHQGDLMVAKMACGTAGLRADATVVIKSTS